MPLRNRITPFNEIVAVDVRGSFTGNRGVLHDDHKSIVRWRNGVRWIICLTEFKGRRRAVMTPGLYTELFFADEAVALAAGHRPCAECRRDRYNAFRRAIQTAGEPLLSAADLDARLDIERRDGNEQRRHVVASASVPDGAMVVIDGAACLAFDGAVFEWSWAGYRARGVMPAGTLEMLTPPLTALALRGGYEVVVALP
jgi:hypothetical protein